MALNVGELVGYLRLDKSQWDRGMTSAESDSKRSGSWMGMLGKGAVLLGGALGVAGIAGATMGLKTAAGLQNAQIAFETMLGSGEKAAAFLEELKDFAAKTPFEFPELQTAASSLISAGFEASQVIPIMTTLGDVTSGMGTGSEGIKRATVALQQMAAAGKITAEDLNQLRDAGVPVFDLLAAATGKSKEAIAEMAATGKLGKEEMQQLFDALEQGKGLERFTGLMEKQSHSLGGVFSTVKDSIQMGLADAIMPLVPLLTDLLPKAAAGLSVVFRLLAGGMKFLIGFFASAGKSGSGLASTWGRVFGAIKSFITDNAATFQAWWSTLQGIFSGLVTLVQAIVGRIVEFWEDHGRRIMSFIGQVWDTVKTIIGSALNVIRGIIDVFIGIFTGDWSKAWDGIKAIFGAVWETIKSILGLAWSFILNIIGSALAAVWDLVVGKFGEITTWLAGLPGGFADAVVALWDWIWVRAGLIKDNVIAWFKTFGDWVAALPAWAVEKGGAIWAWVWEKATEIKDAVVTGFEDLGTWLSGLGDWLAEEAGDVWGWIVSAAKSAAADAWQAIKDQFGGIGGGLLGPGGAGGGLLGGGFNPGELRVPGGGGFQGAGVPGGGGVGGGRIVGGDGARTGYDGPPMQVHQYFQPGQPESVGIDSAHRLAGLVGIL